MAKNKTTQTSVDVIEHINNVVIEKRRKDSLALLEMFEAVTGFKPKMYGPSIIGFGEYHYKYASGHEGDAPLAAFAPRKDSLVIYIESEFEGREQLLSMLGKCKVSKVCVYAGKLEDLDLTILKEIIKKSMQHTLNRYPA